MKVSVKRGSCIAEKLSFALKWSHTRVSYTNLIGRNILSEGRLG